MKKLFFASLCFGAALLAASCSDDEVAKKYQVKVNVEADGAQLSDLRDLTVTLANASGEQVSLKADTVSSTYTANVIAGTYTVSASASDAVYNYAGIQSVTVADQDVETTVVLKGSLKKQGIIFKEVYYTGVNDSYFADDFVEIVNNSDEVKYADGIILALIDRGYGSENSSWADSTGAIPADYYPLSGYVMQIPGNGTEHPLQPGESMVLASQAMNHAARELTDADSPSPVDLSNADFEMYLPTSKKSIDNPDVENMNIVVSSYGYYWMPAIAGQPLALIQLPEGVSTDEFVKDSTNFHVAPGKSSATFCVPCDYVLDAIDIQRFGETQIVKVFHPAQDAGYTWVKGGDETDPSYTCTGFDDWTSPYYCGKSLRRKCVQVTGEGRAYFKDTDNSTEDFVLGGQKAVVRRTFTKAD